jgi:hypothetical protein
MTMDMGTEINTERIELFGCRILDFGKKINPISDIISNSVLFSSIFEAPHDSPVITLITDIVPSARLWIICTYLFE